MSKRSRRTQTPEASSYPSTLSYPEDSHSEGLGHRRAQLERILLDELQALIRDEASDPSLEGIVLLSVHLSVDGGHARVPYVVTAPLHAEEACARRSKAGLERARGFLRSRLAEHLNLKRLPQLSFTFIGLQPDAPMDPNKPMDPDGSMDPDEPMEPDRSMGLDEEGGEQWPE